MSKISLVRIDGDVKHEVDIPVGETIIGRGPVMQCSDKRVSRTHAQIKVSEDGKIELTTITQNPCYYNDDKVITKSSSTELRIGDRFSFLPDSYCYCVKISSDNDSLSEETACSNGILKRGVSTEERPFEVPENGCQPLNAEETSTVCAIADKTADMSVETTDPDIRSSSSTDKSTSSARKNLPSWLVTATERAKQCGKEPSDEDSVTKKTKTERVVGETDTVKQQRGLDTAQNNDGTAERERKGVSTKACQPVISASVVHQMSDDSETEEPGISRRSPVQKAVDTEQASGGPEEKAQSSEGDGAVADTASSHSLAQTSSRDPCRYGTTCYRKNPEHRAEYSHPGDPDYIEDNRPECPYGTDCYRKNPLHKQNYKHTKKQQNPPKKRQRLKKAPTDADGNSDEDDYDYDDPFLNDASSDDYEPTDSGSDLSASEGEEEEDTKRTKKEAKRFVQGKRKH